MFKNFLIHKSRFKNVFLMRNLGLSERQLDAILFFKQKREIVTSVYRRRYNITDRTARRDLIELTEKAILIREGEKKSTKYVYW